MLVNISDLNKVKISSLHELKSGFYAVTNIGVEISKLTQIITLALLPVIQIFIPVKVSFFFFFFFLIFISFFSQIVLQFFKLKYIFN